jgi:sugar lactone lactonase YvrE
MDLLRRRRLLLILLVVAIAIGVTVGFTVPGLFGSEAEVAVPPQFMIYIPDVSGTLEGVGFINNWDGPSAAVLVADRLAVLDTGNSRILLLDAKEKVVSIIGETGVRLAQPEGLAVLDDRLYVANTGAGQVLILSLTGEVEQVITLPADEGDSEPRPTGIVALPDGGFYVSDTANNAVLQYGSDGLLLRVMDADADEAYSFNEPRGLAVDKFGSLYVADSMNGSVRKYSPAGKLQAQFMMEGTPTYSWPVSVAVGPDGTVYFSDRKRRIVQAFSQSNRYLGIVGLYDASRIDSPSVLRDPYGLWMTGDRLYVVDREEGVFAFDIDPAYWVTIVDAQRIGITHGE